MSARVDLLGSLKLNRRDIHFKLAKLNHGVEQHEAASPEQIVNCHVRLGDDPVGKQARPICSAKQGAARRKPTSGVA